MFKYKIGQVVDVMDGWENPLLPNEKIQNRRRVLKGVGVETQYFNEYLIAGKVFDEHLIRGESFLEEHIKEAEEAEKRRRSKPIEEIKKEQISQVNIFESGDQ